MGKMVVIRCFCLKKQKKRNNQPRKGHEWKETKGGKCVCVCVCLCTQVTNLKSKFKPGQDGRCSNRFCRPRVGGVQELTAARWFRQKCNYILQRPYFVPAWCTGACPHDGSELYRWILNQMLHGHRRHAWRLHRVSPLQSLWCGVWWALVLATRHRWPSFPTCAPQSVCCERMGSVFPDSTVVFCYTQCTCWDMTLLRWSLLLAARGGVSWTALFVVYFRLWKATCENIQFATRQHFLAALEVAAVQPQLNDWVRGFGSIYRVGM